MSDRGPPSERIYVAELNFELDGKRYKAKETAPNKKSAQKKAALDIVVRLYKENKISYLNIPFQVGKNDCFTLVRNYMKENLSMELPEEVIGAYKKGSEKKDLQKIILCDVQNEIFPKLEKILINMISESGYPGIKFEKKVDFTKLFNEKFN